MRIPKSEYSLEVTSYLQQTIKALRKENNVRGDVLSKNLGRGISYLYQIENGRIKEIRLETLTQLLTAIVGISDSKFPEFIINLIDSIIKSNDLTSASIEAEEWIAIYDCKYRTYKIKQKTLTYLSKELKARKITPSELVQRMNNPISPDAVNPPYNEVLKLLPFMRENAMSKTIRFSDCIHFRLGDNYIQKIMDKETKTITYPFMAGIIYYLFSDTMPQAACLKKCHSILKNHNFYTISERIFNQQFEFESMYYQVLSKDSVRVSDKNSVIEEKVETISFPPTTERKEESYLCTNVKKPDTKEYIYYDTPSISYSAEYKQFVSKIDAKFTYLFEKNEPYALTKVSSILENMENDLGLSAALMSSSIRSISPELRKDFWNDYQTLLNRYISKSEEKI